MIFKKAIEDKVAEQRRKDAELELERERLEFEKKKFEAKQKTKDRADVSLKEYEELVAEKNRLEKLVADQRETFDKMFSTMGEVKIPPRTMNKIRLGQFKMRVTIKEDLKDLKQWIYVSYELEAGDLL